MAVKAETSVGRRAQVESREQSNINNMTMKKETNIKINMKNINFISDMICLMDGRFIIVKQNGKVNFLSPVGKLEKQLTLPGEASSVTQINQDSIALTYNNVRAITLFNMEQETVTNVTTVDKACWGLSFTNNSLAVGFEKDEIRIIDFVEILSIFNHCNDKVIYTDFKGKAIFCVDESGAQIWEYKQDLYSPTGICTDSYGNIFVANFESERTTVISKRGKDSKVLISEEVGLNGPLCICFNQNKSSCFIGDYLSIYLTKFNLYSG